MRDYYAEPISQLSWRLRAFPGYPVVLIACTKVKGSFPCFTYAVETESNVSPQIKELGDGLWMATDYYEQGNGTIQERKTHYIIKGDFGIYRLSDPLGALVASLT